MAIIKYTQDEITYAIVTGRLYSLKYRESVGDKGKPMATFSIAYDWKKDEFDKAINLYMNCICWSALAEFIGELQERQDKPNVMVCGKIKVSEWNGESREQLEADYIQLQPTTTVVTEEKKPKQKKVVEPEDEDLPF